MKLIKVASAIYIDNYSIEFTFNDGLIGRINFDNLLEGNVYIPLKDIGYFKKFSLNRWTIEWPNGADFAPEFLYQKIEQKVKVHNQV